MAQRMIPLEAIDRALGRCGQPPQPLDTGLSLTERDTLLEQALCFPDRPLPTGELGDWAAVLMSVGKEPNVMAAVAVVETAMGLTPSHSPDIDFVQKVLAELHVWLSSSKDTPDLRRLGDLWWSLTRNPPEAANTPLGDAAFMAWFVAGYDPEGSGNPPDDREQLLQWMDESANNVTAIVDVFSTAQQAVGKEHAAALVDSVRESVAAWREMDSATI